MINKFSKTGFLWGLILILIIVFRGGTDIALADDGPRRTKTIEVIYTEYEWWLVRWEDDGLVCDLYLDHDEPPTANEIDIHCGSDVYNQWVESAP